MLTRDTAVEDQRLILENNPTLLTFLALSMNIYTYGYFDCSSNLACARECLLSTPRVNCPYFVL